jgi:hypothetical protein
MSRESVQQELKNGIEDLRKNIDKFHPGACERVAFEVLKDPKVQDAFVNLINRGYDFSDISCQPFGIEQTKIRFQFSFRPPKIGFYHPSFVVTYDYTLRKVVGEIEYFPKH